MPSANPLRLVFAGTPEFAAAHLRAISKSEHEIAAVYTQPDRRAGRGKKLTASPVKQLAEDLGLLVHQPSNFKEPGSVEELAKLNADAMIVVAYGLLLPQAVLDTPKLGCVNVHASLLPRWRGAAPIQRCIEAGDTETGITIMAMDAGLDTGPMLSTSKLAIEAGTSAGQLHDQLMELGPTALVEVLKDLEHYLANASAQEDEATYAHKLSREDAALNWEHQARNLLQKILAFNPAPGCWTRLGDDVIKIWQARLSEGKGQPGEILAADKEGLLVACGQGALCLETIQLPGGKPLAVSQILNARREMFEVGGVLAS